MDIFKKIDKVLNEDSMTYGRARKEITSDLEFMLKMEIPADISELTQPVGEFIQKLGYLKGEDAFEKANDILDDVFYDINAVVIRAIIKKVETSF